MNLEAAAVDVVLGTRTVLRRFSIAVAPGQLVAVIGPNGAGKTTLLRTLCGLLSPSSGRVTLDGEDVASIEALRRGRAMAYVPQSREAAWPITVEHVVGLGRVPHGGTMAKLDAEGDTAVGAALAAMKLESLSQRAMNALSGGERARALIARALAQQTPIIVADEPVAGLDPAHQVALAEHLRTLAGQGRTVVMAIHDLSLALRFATHAVLLDNGRVAASGPVSDVMTPQGLEAIFGLRVAISQIEGVPVAVPLAARS